MGGDQKPQENAGRHRSESQYSKQKVPLDRAVIYLKGAHLEIVKMDQCPRLKRDEGKF